jgi:uncharacterized membrane protein
MLNQITTTAAAKIVNFLEAFCFLTLDFFAVVFFATTFLLCFGFAAGLT